jgi:hypothetical protein
MILVPGMYFSPSPCYLLSVDHTYHMCVYMYVYVYIRYIIKIEISFSCAS